MPANTATATSNTPTIHLSHRFLRQKDVRIATKPASRLLLIVAGFAAFIFLMHGKCRRLHDRDATAH
jgi:hypothetical protein